MGRYHMIKEEVEDQTVYILKDDHKQAEAKLVPTIGNNLYSYIVEGIPILLEPKSLSVLKSEPARSGYPILFPPNRTYHGCFTFNERVYQLPVNTPEGHHIHGEFKSKPWKVAAYGADDEQGAYVTSVFNIADDPSIYRHFNHDLHFILTYRIKNGELTLEGSITNHGKEEAPFALGFHPYFCVPSAGAKLKVPASEEWPLKERFICGLPERTEYSTRLNEGIDISTIPDEGYQMIGLEHIKAFETHEMLIELLDEGKQIKYEFDHLFPFLVIFNPPGVNTISLEPYTCLTDAFNLPYSPERTGARGIGAGNSMNFKQKLKLINLN